MLDLESKPVSKHQDKMKVPYSSPRNWSSLTARAMAFLFPSLWALDAGGFPPLYLVPIRFSRRPFGGLPLDAPHASQVTHLLPVPHRRCFLSLQGLPCLLVSSLSPALWLKAPPRQETAWLLVTLYSQSLEIRECIGSVLWTLVESMNGTFSLITIHIHTTR